MLAGSPRARISLPLNPGYACFGKAFGGSADMWLRMQAAYDLAQVRQHEGQIVIRRLRPSAAPQSARLAKQA